MKKRLWIPAAVVLLTFGASLPSHASPTCLAPEPTCAVVLLGTVVTAIVHDTDEQQVRHPKADPTHVPPRVSVGGIEPTDDERRVSRARDPAGGRPMGVPR